MTQGASGSVLVCGAINTDLVGRCRRAPEAGETVTGTSFAVFGGGKGANQTLSCARSGAPTAMLGAVGDDDFGAQRLADLRADGVDVRGVAVVPGVASGVALITVEESGQNRIAYIPGATAKVTVEQANQAYDVVKPTALLMTLELPHGALASIIARARSDGATVIVNATPEPADGLAIAKLADVLIVNETEALELLGEPGSTTADWAAVGKRLLEIGPTSIVMTLGAAGAMLLTADGVESMPAPKVVVVDTTGAGDAACGAIAARLAAGSSLRDAVRAGVIAGSISVTRPGAQPSQPYKAEIDAQL